MLLGVRGGRLKILGMEQQGARPMNRGALTTDFEFCLYPMPCIFILFFMLSKINNNKTKPK